MHVDPKKTAKFQDTNTRLRWWLVVGLVVLIYLGIYAIIEAVRYYHFGDIVLNSYPDSVPNWLVVFLNNASLLTLVLPGLIAGCIARSAGLRALLVGVLIAVPIEFFYGIEFKGGPIMLLIGIEKMIYFLIPILALNLIAAFLVIKLRKLLKR